MAGVLRATVNIATPVQNPLFCSIRGLRTYARPLRKDAKDAKPAEPIKGIPYKNLSIGVPKEIWTNERRYPRLLTLRNKISSLTQYHC